MSKHKAHLKHRAYDGLWEVVEWHNLDFPRWVCVAVLETKQDAMGVLTTRLSR